MSDVEYIKLLSECAHSTTAKCNSISFPSFFIFKDVHMLGIALVAFSLSHSESPLSPLLCEMMTDDNEFEFKETTNKRVVFY